MFLQGRRLTFKMKFGFLAAAIASNPIKAPAKSKRQQISAFIATCFRYKLVTVLISENQFATYLFVLYRPMILYADCCRGVD